MWSPALKASSRIGSIGSAVQRRSVFTRLARQPTTGVCNAEGCDKCKYAKTFDRAEELARRVMMNYFGRSHQATTKRKY